MEKICIFFRGYRTFTKLDSDLLSCLARAKEGNGGDFKIGLDFVQKILRLPSAGELDCGDKVELVILS